MNKPAEATVVNNIIALKRHIKSAEHTLSLLAQRVGMLDCMTIFNLNVKMKELEIRHRDLHEDFVSHGLLDTPLLQATTKTGETYNIVLARIDKLVVGEYETIDELLVKLDAEESISLEDSVNSLGENLMNNSLTLYTSIKSKIKLSPKGKKFEGLNTSNIRKYLYFYPGDRKKTLGFIAERLAA